MLYYMVLNLAADPPLSVIMLFTPGPARGFHNDDDVKVAIGLIETRNLRVFAASPAFKTFLG